MFEALKTNDKFNPYMIIIPAASVLCAYQLGKVTVGLIRIGAETLNKKISK